MFKTLHIFMQGKGGVGKSFCANMLMQYMIEQGMYVVGWDSDPSNQTLASFKGLNVKIMDTLENQDNVQIGALDKLNETISLINDNTELQNQDVSAVLDVGSSNYIQTLNYLSSRRLDGLGILQSSLNIRMVFHVPIIGGEPYKDCWSNFNEMCFNLPDCDFILWINNYPNRVFNSVLKMEDQKEYVANQDRVKGIVDMPTFEPTTDGKSLRLILNNNLTFNEVANLGSAIDKRDLTVIEIYRGKRVKTAIFNAIDVIKGLL